MLSNVESDMNFIPACFVNEWLEMHRKISSRSPNCTDSLRDFTVSSFFKCSNCFGCFTWGSQKFDKIFR